MQKPAETDSRMRIRERLQKPDDEGNVDLFDDFVWQEQAHTLVQARSPSRHPFLLELDWYKQRSRISVSFDGGSRGTDSVLSAACTVILSDPVNP